MAPEAFIILTFCIALPLFIMAREALFGQVFSLLFFYSLIFFVETAGGVIKAVFPGITRSGGALDEWLITQTLFVTFFGYLLFLIGYFVSGRITRPTFSESSKMVWNYRYFTFLFAAMLVVLAVGLYPIYQRVVTAGGIRAFLDTAYLYRFGTFAESDQQSALLAFANMFSACSRGLVGLGVLAWIRGGLSAGEQRLLVLAIALLFLKESATMLRSSVLFTAVALLAIYYSDRRLPLRKIATIAIALAAVLVALNVLHQHLYTATAGWERQTFAETVGGLLAPHAHFQTLAATVERVQGSGQTLGGRGLVESVFFFVPRVFWESKLPASEFGTQLIQAWLEVPTWYQMAVTNTGELVAHFGYLGMFGLLIYGGFYGYFDSFRRRGPELQVALYCMLLPRVLVDAGMGISAFSNTLLGLAMFLGMTKALSFLAGPVTQQLVSPSSDHPDLIIAESEK